MDYSYQLGIKQTDFRGIFGGTTIDYDPAKEESNRKKHGYSLESAADLLEKWVFPVPSTPFITSDPIEKKGDIRHQHMGVDGNGNIVFVVTTMRAEETVRVISFRKASLKERKLFNLLTGYNKLLNPTRKPLNL